MMLDYYNHLSLNNLVSKCKYNWVGDKWEGLEWLDERPCPTKEEWETEKSRLIAEQPLQNCKTKAQSLLNESDFADLYSVRNKLENINEWDTYRDTLRNLRINPIENPIFPEKPKTIWKEIIPISIQDNGENIK